MNTGILRQLLRAPWETFDSIDSTNEFLLNLPEEKAVSGYTCSANYQTAGRGRKGRKWFSPEGGVYISFLFKPTANLALGGLLSLALSIAVAETIKQACPRNDVRLKWPNDVLLDRKKVSGILLEARSGRHSRMVAGIGINIKPLPIEVARQALFPPTSLQQAGCTDIPPVDVFAEKCRENVFSWYLVWENDPYSIPGLWLNHAIPRGSRITVREDKGLVVGRFSGITSEGHLEVESPAGLQVFSSAEITKISSGE